MSTFFLTSGRSGSTLLARCLRAHPDIAVISDLFEPVGDEPYFDCGREITGDEFWQMLIRPSSKERIAHWRKQPTDELLYLPDDDADVSLLMSYTLPFLSSDPWALRREVEPAVRATARATAPAHLVQLFDLIRRRCGADVWVERTGGSLPHAAQMIAAWPDARFVFLLRDPVETALSMRTGSFFRLYLAMETDEAASWTDERFANSVRLAEMVDRWTSAADRATEALAPEQLLTITFEQLMSDPSAVLLRLLAHARPGAHTELDREWAASQAQTITPPVSRAATLAPAESDAVRAACPQATAIWRAADSQPRHHLGSDPR